MRGQQKTRLRERLRAELPARDFCSVPEAALLLGCAESTVRQACATGQIPATRLGVKWFIPAAWLRRQLDPGEGEGHAA